MVTIDFPTQTNDTIMNDSYANQVYVIHQRDGILFMSFECLEFPIVY